MKAEKKQITNNTVKEEHSAETPWETPWEAHSIYWDDHINTKKNWKDTMEVLIIQSMRWLFSE